METQLNLLELAANAKAAQEAARAAEAILNKHLRDAVKLLMPVGSFIDLSAPRPLPDHLQDVNVVTGNARGTQRFRIEQICSVKSNASCFGHSKWTCEATPISMTTGADMSGRTGKGRGATAVTITGYLGGERTINESTAEINARVAKTIDALFAEANRNSDEGK